MRVVASIIAMVAASSLPLRGQATRALTAPPAHTIDQWTTADGLPQNSVNAIVQTPDGYLWVGTFGGLARFDGTSFTLMERTDSLGRHTDRVLSLAVDLDSALWVGTENGLLRYRDGRFERYTTDDGLPDDEIHDVHVDEAGAVWVGTERGGLARFSGGRFESFGDAAEAPFDHVISIVEDGRGRLWLNARDRFVTLDRGTPPRLQRGDPPVPGSIHMLLEDRTGARWFRLLDGVARVAGGTVSVYREDVGVPGPVEMVEDPEAGLWLGTYADGVVFLRRDSGRVHVRRYPLPDGTRAYEVRAAHVDREGNIWFGTNASGLLRARRNLFTNYTTANGLSHDIPTAVYEDSHGAMWVGTNCGGLDVIDPERRRVRTLKPPRPGSPLGDPCVFSLTEQAPGIMWVGTYGGGLTRVTPDGVERLHRAGGLRDSVVLALYTDRDGTVWVGTNAGGLAALDGGGRVKATYTTADGLVHNSVRAIRQTRDGALWIGTLEGMSRLDADGRLTSFTRSDGLSAGFVRAFHEDADGNLWIGTYGGGLNVLRDNGDIAAVTQADGLADDVVSAILEDGHGNLWMSGNRGIYRVARRELLAFVEGRRRRVRSVLYGTADGLHNPETNGGFQPAAWRSDDGRLWFPTIEGVAVVDPSRAAEVQPPPPVVVEGVVVDGEVRPAGRAIQAGAGRPNVEFRYAELDLSAPQHVRFRYRLDGFDEAWVEAGTRRVAYYPRLPPGRYRFAVAAANRDGVWNDEVATVALRVLPPFWRTWWFLGATVVAVAALVGLVVRRRALAARRERAAREAFARRLIESQEHERRRIAGELHDDLGQELMVVKNRAIIALEEAAANGAVREQLEQITDTLTRTLANVRDLAHNLTPHQLDHLGLAEELRAMTDAVADSSAADFDVRIGDVDGLLAKEAEINLFRIVQEAVNNVVKHADAARVTIRVEPGRGGIDVVVADDGRGFVPPGAGGAAGFGLSGIAERVRILGGRHRLVSAPGRGTRLEVTVPTAAAGSAATAAAGAEEAGS